MKLDTRKSHCGIQLKCHSFCVTRYGLICNVAFFQLSWIGIGVNSIPDSPNSSGTDRRKSSLDHSCREDSKERSDDLERRNSNEEVKS